MVEQSRPWKRGLAWLLLLAPFFFTTYSFSNWLAAQRSDVGSVVFDWEIGMPFVPWTILPYWVIDLFYGLSLLIPRSRDELDAHAKRLFTAQVISVLCFIAFPLRFSFERPETSGVFGWLFDVLLGFDQPFNQAPSLHISLLVILWTLYARYLSGWWLWLLRLIAVSIGLSVLTTYQHHFIDIPTGALVGCIAVMLFPLQPQTAIIQRDPRRFVLGAYYLAGAVVLTVLAALLQGAWLWLLWGACALTAVASIYFLGNPLLFRNHNGRMEEAVLVLLAPYLLCAWLNSRCWTYKHPEPSEIVSGLWLSRLPSRSVIKQLQAVTLVDCCAELPVIPCGQAVYGVPMLDLLAPEVAQIEQGVAVINAARQTGNTLVFCALGYSRSAVIIIASLIDQGLAASIDEAVNTVRKARPRLVLSALHRAKLEDWYERNKR
ncbi:MAG: phosphatase PAP2/dual specificity phosphatase family protein [Methylococcales bacterium]|nr:phosphatase PAP2/dual specificity phosphatase family protein [Methylococcales bacterium]